jgi:hypothetical protein
MAARVWRSRGRIVVRALVCRLGRYGIPTLSKLAPLGTAVMALLFVGCGSSSSTVGEPPAQTVLYELADGEVTVQVPHPWVSSGNSGIGRSLIISLTPKGAGPTTDGGERIDWDELVLMADPALVGTGCQAGARPADAEALAESIRSVPDLGATAPVAVSAGGTEALMLDVIIAAGASVPFCENELGVMNLLVDPEAGEQTFDGTGRGVGHASGERMRLYLVNAPEGSSRRVLAIAIVAPESRFESVIEAAGPLVDSVEFQER